MHFKEKILILFLCVALLSCKTNEPEVVSPQIIPAPQSLAVENDYFLFNTQTVIEFQEELKVVEPFFKDVINWFYSLELYGKSNKIIFSLDASIENAEGYTIDVSKDLIEIKSKTPRGAFYAIQTFRQILPHQFENDKTVFKEVKIPFAKIADAPQFPYRGMHLDVSRHMYSVEFIKKYIDAMAMLKMNTFHWHLTDDQGWRVEIKKYPRLNEVSSFRNETLIGHYSDQPHQFDGTRYGGFYTQKEIKDIVSYASARMITVVPEIEMPGHSQAVIAAYPDLGCTREKVDVATKWGVFEDIYCTKEDTFKFLEDVLDEVLELFPSEYIHIGGDEAPKTRWKTCKDCQARIKSEGLKDEHELQSYFITRIEKYLNSKGRKIIGWDEILEGGLAPNATVMSWRGTDGAVKGAQAGHNVIMTPTSHAYFDYYQSDNEDEPLAIGGFLPLEKVYGFNPIPEELTAEEAKYVLGAQGNVWTEYMPTENHVEYMTFPRMLAMAEVNWTASENKNYADFVKRLEHFHKRLDALDINYANHLYEIEGDMTSINGDSFFRLFTLTEGKDIRYTLDGSEPNLKSTIYTSQIPIIEDITIKASVFSNDEKLGKTFTQSINYHKAVGAEITIDKTPHKAYSGSGAQGLINGISGSDTRYGDKEWLGFWGEDIEITIDLSKIKKVDSIKTRFHNGQGQWIYAPERIDLMLILDDGSRVIDNVSFQHENKIIEEFNYIFKYPKGMGIKVKSINLKIPNYGTIPDGKQGAGNKAWTFIDEIIVK